MPFSLLLLLFFKKKKVATGHGPWELGKDADYSGKGI
jgi:hypothetical protein